MDDQQESGEKLGLFGRWKQRLEEARQIRQAQDETLRSVNSLPLDGFSRARKDNFWRFNRSMAQAPMSNKQCTVKLRVAFDGENNCKSFNEKDFGLAVKVGPYIPDEKENLQHKFVGFIYGNESNRTALLKLASEFPYAELIDGLDPHSWQMTKTSIKTVLNSPTSSTNLP